jgi:Tat protein secretion system quality control protein TatD with DNase activity
VVIETDSPDLLPQDQWRRNPDQANEPAYLVDVLERLASLWGQSSAQAADQLAQTSRHLARLYFAPGPR